MKKRYSNTFINVMKENYLLLILIIGLVFIISIQGCQPSSPTLTIGNCCKIKVGTETKACIAGSLNNAECAEVALQTGSSYELVPGSSCLNLERNPDCGVDEINNKIGCYLNDGTGVNKFYAQYNPDAPSPASFFCGYNTNSLYKCDQGRTVFVEDCATTGKYCINGVCQGIPIKAEYSLYRGTGQIVADVSGNNLHGFLGNSDKNTKDDPTWTTTPWDYGLLFNGYSTYVTLQNGITPLDMVSIDASIDTSTTTGNLPIYTDANLRLRVENNKLVFERKDNSGIFRDCISNTNLITGNYNYVVATYDGANVKLYIRGELDNTCPQSFSISTDTQVEKIGEGFYGTIDFVNIYSIALSAQQIKDKYDTIFRQVCSCLWASECDQGPVLDTCGGTCLRNTEGNVCTIDSAIGICVGGVCKNAWNKIGQLGTDWVPPYTYVNTLASGDKLYAGLAGGNVYSYDGAVWNELGFPETVMGISVQLLVFDNNMLYAGTTKNIFYYDGANWVKLENSPKVNYKEAFAIYDDGSGAKVYVAADDPYTGKQYIYRWDGGTTWTIVGDLTGNWVGALEVYNNQLYAGASTGRVYRYDGGTTWTIVGEGVAAGNTLEVYDNNLYSGGWGGPPSGGDVYSYDGATWTNIGGIGGSKDQLKVGPDNKLYAATSQGNYRYDGGTTWTYVGLNATYSLGVYNNKLYSGDLMGNVYVFAS